VASAGVVVSTTLAFDRIAPHYDALADGELFRLMRRRTHHIFMRWLRPGHRVLEIGCGTGIDTAFLAAHGVSVVACDPSEAMVGRTLSRLANEHRSKRATVMPCGLQNLEMFLDALGERAPFDGIISNFGALNCVECLEPLAHLAAKSLRPGGAVVLGLIGRHCAAEAIYFAFSGRRDQIGRRQGEGAVRVPVAGVDVPTYFHRTGDVVRTLSRSLQLKAIAGIGVALPPPYLEPRWQMLRPFVRASIANVDALLTSWPLVNRLADHVLLQFVKPSDFARGKVPHA
jgi:SAM-dependent methyltransferase